MDIENRLEKIEFHLKLIGEVINHMDYPVESLVLGLNWSSDDLDKAHDIFEKFYIQLEENKAPKLLHIALETDFEKELGVDYQTVKLIVLAFFRNQQWVEVCEAYAKSFGNSPPVEVQEIIRNLRSSILD